MDERQLPYDEWEGDILMHHGVLGMKWGVRKANREAKRSAKKAAKADYKRRVKETGARLKRDKGRVEFRDFDTKARTKSGDAVIERILYDSKGKEYSTQDLNAYYTSKRRKQAVAWTAGVLASGLGAAAYNSLRRR